MGAPTTTAIFLSDVDLAINSMAFKAPRSSALCPNRSPQVYPVTHNSGNTSN